jgi:hypothetical protein
MLRHTLGEDIQLQFKFAIQPLFIHADAGMMDQVLMNLAVNARDAMPRGGQLAIETSVVDLDEVTAAQTPPARPGSFVCLSVGDTGCGIPPEILPRIFEPPSGHRLWHRPTTSRLDYGAQRSWPGHDHPGLPAATGPDVRAKTRATRIDPPGHRP